MFHIKEINETSVINCAAFEWVSNTWDIVFNPWNHGTLMKDSFFINSLVFFMDEQDEIVIKKALEICYLLLQNRCNYEALGREQNVTNGLSLAFKRYRPAKLDRPHLRFLCREALRKLRDPDYQMAIRDGLALRDKQDEALWGATVVQFLVPGMSAANEVLVRRTLAGVGGVTSATCDLARRTVTLNASHGFSTGMVLSTVAARLLLSIEVVHPGETKPGHDDGDVTDDDSDDVAGDQSERLPDLPPYYPDVDSPLRTRGALTTAEAIQTTASGIVSWFRESFYW